MDGMIEIQVECPRCKEKRTVATIEGDGTRYSYCRLCLEKLSDGPLSVVVDRLVGQTGGVLGMGCPNCGLDCRCMLLERKRGDELLNHLEIAWGVIANASGGDWTKESKDWQGAASKWRDDYHAILTKFRQST